MTQDQHRQTASGSKPSMRVRTSWDAREARQAGHKDEIANVLAKGAQRDEVAAARDWDAARRDMAANKKAWLTGDERRGDAEARQDALDDRLHPKGDRASSATDRSVLANIADDDDPV